MKSKSWFDVLAHPLFLLVVGSIVSSYLIPNLTRRWQDHQRELELKVSLVSAMSQSVAEIVLPTAFDLVGMGTQEDGNLAYRKWEVSHAVTEAQLRAYFPSSGIASDWATFSRMMTLACALEVTESGVTSTSTPDLKKYLPDLQLDWLTLAKCSKQCYESREYKENWDRLIGALRVKLGAIQQRLLASKSSL
jgi:hypothetical protein